MKYKLSTLANGLRILTVPMPTLESATVTVWVGTGSRFESPEIEGISHFLEHMVFKGSKKRPSAKQIAEAIDAIGGEFNAATSKDWTNFYIRSRAAQLETTMDVLSDMVLNPTLDASDIEREKGVIIEEIAMYEDTPMQNIGNVFEQLIFDGNQLGQNIAGTAKSVNGITKQDFEDYRKKHYFAKNIVVSVAGGIEQKQVLALAQKYFGSLKSDIAQKQKLEMVSNTQTAPAVKLKTKANSEQGHFILGFRGFPRGHKDKYAEAVLSSILGGGMSSRMFTEIREKRGLAYAVSADSEHYEDTGYFGIYAGVVVSKIDEAIKAILDELYSLAAQKSEISDSELTKAKEYLKGHMALALENTKAVNSFFGMKELLQAKIETPEEVFAGINKVTKEDVYKVASILFKPEKLNLAIIGPYKDEGKFVKLLN
ncbi:MAG: pitrilysin family protein [Patescibacteria group bacterium]